MKVTTKQKLVAAALFPAVAVGVAVVLFLVARDRKRTRERLARIAELDRAENEQGCDVPHFKRETMGEPW